jgi:hypothetical protein
MGVEDAALRLADLKAMAVARREPEALVIGADQILVCAASGSTSPLMSPRRAGSCGRCADVGISW